VRRAPRWQARLTSTYRSEAVTFAADYFDGHTTRAHRVTLSIDAGDLVMVGKGIARRESLSALRVSEPMGVAPRLITFRDGTHCQVAADALPPVFAKTLVVRMQESWRAAAASVVVAALAVVAAYVWGLPAFAAWIANRVPASIQAEIGDGTLQFLDARVFSPSALPATRQDELREAFRGMARSGNDRPQPYRVLFRDGGRIGANALALPDGTILMTDQLVGLAKTDEEILAVLAHELGHLERRHSLRMLIQGSIVAFAIGWYFGDLGGLVAAMPALMLQLRYSRGLEREADEFAATMMRANGVAPSRLADMLAKLDAAARRDRQEGAPDYLATHPATEERIRSLREM